MLSVICVFCDFVSVKALMQGSIIENFQGDFQFAILSSHDHISLHKTDRDGLKEIITQLRWYELNVNGHSGPSCSKGG